LALLGISHKNLANAVRPFPSKDPARPGSTGFSLCGFDFRTYRKAHRLKSVLPKPASHRNAMQGVNFAN
jgi:hypothetical protein